MNSVKVIKARQEACKRSFEQNTEEDRDPHQFTLLNPHQPDNIMK